MNTYVLFWLTGQHEVIEGDSISVAMTNAGYSGGAVAALDFYADATELGVEKIISQHVWNKETHSWVPSPEYIKELMG